MEKVIEICKRVVPGLGNMREAIVTLLPSGSNKVYLVESLVPDGLGRAIYREFGAKEIVNVQYERVIAKRLGDLGIGPKTYEQTDTYRVEEFLPGRTLERTEVRSPTLIPLICASFHQFHSLDMSAVVPVIPTAIRNAQIWREKCVSNLPNCSIDIGDLLSEELHTRFLSLVPATASLFFCHQDCYCLNYLYTPSSETLRLLDYEYAGYCYRGMDFASLLNGLLYDYQSPDPPYLTYHPADRCTDDLLTQYISA
jgi:choline/ethanolamine kinase